MKIRQLDRVLSEISTQRIDVINQASIILSDYWDWFAEQNNAIYHQRAAGLSSLAQAYVAPVLERKSSGQKKRITESSANSPLDSYAEKYYLVWKLFDNSNYRRVNPRASKPIRIADPDKTIAIVGKHCTWEYEKFCEAELKLGALRILLDGLHDAEIRIRSAYRKMNRRYSQ